MAALCVEAQEASVLATGRWWRLTATQAGMYRLTVSDLPALQGTSIDSIGLFGRGGGMLSIDNRQTSYADLQPVTIDVRDNNGNGRFDNGDEVLFFGEGAEKWSYSQNDDRWEFEHHAYTTCNYYYLTTSATTVRHIAVSGNVPEATSEVTSFTSVTHIDNDLVNIFGTGQLWMGEPLGVEELYYAPHAARPRQPSWHL